MIQDKPHFLAHRQRLRSRFQRSGLEGLEHYELLELLLGYAIPRKDVKPIAKDLIKRFGSLAGVLNAGQKELEALPGVGPMSGTLIRLVKALCLTYLGERMQQRDLLASPQAVVDYGRMKLAGLPHEVFMVVYLNTKNELIGQETIHEGTVDRAIIYPRRIVEAALAHHASGLILVHNHPSGHPQPSEEDKRLTQTLIRAAGLVDVRIVDHIVIGRNGYFSFVEHRLLSG